MMRDTTALLQELLTRAAAAHGVHEQEDLGGVYDEQWPRWYAGHMSAALTERGLRLAEIDDSAREELRQSAEPLQ